MYPISFTDNSPFVYLIEEHGLLFPYSFNADDEEY